MLDDEFVSYKRIELDFEYLYELPEFLKDNTYSNPYSNISLNIPPGLGFLDLQFGQNLTDDQTQYTNEPDNTSTSDSQQQKSKTGTTSKSTFDFFNEVEPMIRLSVERHSAELGITDQNQKELAIKCIATQMALETGSGTSNLWKKYNNPGGLTYTSFASNYGGQRGNKLPDGNANYIYFNNRANAIEMMVDGFYNKMGRYKGILAQSKSVRDFVTRIKRAGYFGGSLSTYANNCEKFGKEYDNWKRTKLSWNT